MKIIKRLIYILIALITITGFSFLIAGYDRYREVTKEMPLDFAVSQITSDPTYVGFEKMDRDYVNAVISIEDHRFFDRNGIDFVAIGRAFFVNLTSKEIKEGGSTITQQVAKNIYFSNKPSLSRKVAEIFLVNDLENEYSKEEIFAMYVNIIYFGDRYYGIKQASEGYFQKAPDDLSLYEATILAGLPQSPSRFQLSNGYELINKRQRLVLKSMVDNGYITQQQMDEALLLQPKE